MKTRDNGDVPYDCYHVLMKICCGLRKKWVNKLKSIEWLEKSSK